MATLLHHFQQIAEGCCFRSLRVNEKDGGSARPFAGRLVDDFETLGAQVIELRHVPEWQLVLPGRPAGAAIRALAWLGPKRAGAALRAIRKGLPQSELQAMVGLRGRLPTWMAEEVSALANGV